PQTSAGAPEHPRRPARARLQERSMRRVKIVCTLGPASSTPEMIEALVALIATGCIYPRRSTSLTPVARADAGMISAPSDIWQLTIVGAEVSPRKRGDLPWDEGGRGRRDGGPRRSRGGGRLREGAADPEAHHPR